MADDDAVLRAARPLRVALATARALALSLALGGLIGALCGVASAVFLGLLERATATRLAHPQIVYALPVAGLALGFVYQRLGATIRGGNNLVLDTLHDAGPMIPARMGPMVLVGTVLTHLFGGSAGREGAAVQMGAGLADLLAHRFRVAPAARLQLVAAGVAGGFGSVFGTPVAGVVFALEVVALGAIDYGALAPALAASLAGDIVCRALGAHHTAYPTVASLALSPLLCAKWAVFALAVTAASVAFVELTHFIKRRSERHIPKLPLRMSVGGVLVVSLWLLVGARFDYLGLGLPLIASAFSGPSMPAYVFALKLLFTAVTLGFGFLGGEVTPLFVIGACLGSTLAEPLGLPRDLAVGVGLAAVFAASSNAPLALSIMAVELFGGGAFPHVVLVSALAYMMSGHRGIYSAQRVARGKDGVRFATARPLRDVHRR